MGLKTLNGLNLDSEKIGNVRPLRNKGFFIAQ